MSNFNFANKIYNFFKFYFSRLVCKRYKSIGKANLIRDANLIRISRVLSNFLRFLSLYPLAKSEGSAPQEISLDGTARALGTEKRRIYDIINVLESLEMATKAGKNRYLWHGQSGLVATLIKFKSLAIKLGLREQIREIQRINKAYTGDNCEDSPSTWMDNALIFDDIDEDTSGDAAIREDKSLGAMCQKFVMLFLISLKVFSSHT